METRSQCTLPGTTFSCSPFRFLSPHSPFLPISPQEKLSSTDDNPHEKYDQLLHMHQYRPPIPG